MSKKKIQVMDLFAGVGGLSYGLLLTGKFEVPIAIEFEKSIADSFAKNHPETNVLCEDITKINLEKDLAKYKGKIDIIVGGPPCQGFSLKGKKLGLNDERNFLFKTYYEFVKYFKPTYFIIENVPGILTEEKGYFKKEIIRLFTELGYSLDMDVVNAANYGVPQSRRRAIIIGKQGNIVKVSELKKKKAVTSWEAISDLDYLNSGEGNFESEYKFTPKTEYQEMMRKNSKKLYNHQATNHSDIALERLRLIKPECGKECLPEHHLTRSIFGETWGRLIKDKPSPTIITRFDTPSNGRNSHPHLHRAITPREAARLQSFPDKFIFYGNKSSVIKQIGNAVPPLLGKALGELISRDWENE